MKKYLLPVAEVYCLMPNHFHLIIRIKEDWSEQMADIQEVGFSKLNKKMGLHAYKSLAS